MKSGVVASVLLAVAIPNATAEDIAFHTEYVPQQLFDAKREAPVEIVGETSQSLCQSMYEKDNFTFYRFESDARLKEARFGLASLDSDDRKWLSNLEFRRTACMKVLEHAGSLGIWSKIKIAIIGFLNSH